MRREVGTPSKPSPRRHLTLSECVEHDPERDLHRTQGEPEEEHPRPHLAALGAHLDGGFDDVFDGGGLDGLVRSTALLGRWASQIFCCFFRNGKITAMERERERETKEAFYKSTLRKVFRGTTTSLASILAARSLSP